MFKTQFGDVVIYELHDGALHRTAHASGPPDTARFVIVCTHGDWSGFRTLSECVQQFTNPGSDLLTRPNGSFAIVAR